MAEVQDELVLSGVKSKANEVFSESRECNSCIQLKLELEMTRQELNSARKIIQILQEDSNITNDYGQEAKSDQQANQNHQEFTSNQQNQHNEVSEPETNRTSPKQEVQNNRGYKIPTILNGKIVSSEVSDQQKTTRLQEKSAKYQNTECKLSGTAT